MMKWKNRRCLVVVCCLFMLLSDGIVNAQPHPILSEFNVQKTGSRIYLSWTIKEGNSCLGTSIFRSVDSIQYERIGEIFGICGNDSIPQEFSFIDGEPVANKKNFYRLELGNTGFTEVVSVFYLTPGSVLLFPNPAHGQLNIRFENDKSQEAILILFDGYGRIIQSVATKENQFRFPTQSLASGIYYYHLQISEAGFSKKGRFMVNQ